MTSIWFLTHAQEQEHGTLRPGRSTGQGKACTLPDLDGLALAVTAAGGRTWHFRCYWADKRKLPLPPVNHNPFLRMAELPRLLQRLRSHRGRRQTQLGLRLLLLTGVRTGELRQAMPDQFDLDCGLWIIPPDVVRQLRLDVNQTCLLYIAVHLQWFLERLWPQARPPR